MKRRQIQIDAELERGLVFLRDYLRPELGSKVSLTQAVTFAVNRTKMLLQQIDCEGGSSVIDERVWHGTKPF